MAIRLGELADSGLVARRLEDAALCLVAAPDYLRRAGTPRNLDELAGHACLPFTLPSTGRQSPWLLRVDGRDVDWPAPPRMRVADDVLGVVSLAQQGLGAVPDLPLRGRGKAGQRPAGRAAARAARPQAGHSR